MPWVSPYRRHLCSPRFGPTCRPHYRSPSWLASLSIRGIARPTARLCSPSSRAGSTSSTAWPMLPNRLLPQLLRRPTRRSLERGPPFLPSRPVFPSKSGVCAISRTIARRMVPPVAPSSWHVVPLVAMAPGDLAELGLEFEADPFVEAPFRLEYARTGVSSPLAAFVICCTPTSRARTSTATGCRSWHRRCASRHCRAGYGMPAER